MSTPDLAALVGGMRRALDGGPPVAPLPRLTAQAPPSGTALVVRTSGSTGTPREVALTAEALRAAAAATRERLGAAGRWVLTLPPTHVAGMQVIVRSLLAGTPLTVAGPGPFRAEALAELLADPLAGDDPVHLSLVPTQLHRVVEAADGGAPAALEALARCGAVLLGGAATPPRLLARARDAGVPVVRTYGMSETAGGCVYDGLPLRGVRVRVDAPGGHPGVVELGGPVLATGYLGDDEAGAAAFSEGPDGRWFRTSDLGVVDDGVLRVLGRADDVVVTGGVNVAPTAVETVLGELLGAEVCVVGVPHDEWGQELVAVLSDAVGGDGEATELARVRSAVAARLGPAAAPRRLLRVADLPLRGPGKVDRAAVVDLVRARSARD
ncbi:AMP-binding protein [Isoptericola halotolerans]|uniref:O-succinylbenzoic acid--CoA ligase n=1 Tax=Isoptericola halotolerans TaxID=300560 RepID=A0ABX2A308_9MICO|nr:O-succinylbenzoic acid--CoA ligase [Isoptericola halotolerans]